mgnify:CR=1 FL=1
MRKRNLMRLAAVLTAGVMMATGCSNGASAPTEGTTAESTEAETTEAESAEGEETDSASDEAQGDGPLVIADQGIFSAGGITVTSEGTFNPEDHWEETGAGQTSHVDHANVLYQIPEDETEARRIINYLKTMKVTFEEVR